MWTTMKAWAVDVVDCDLTLGAAVVTWWAACLTLLLVLSAPWWGG